MKVGLVGNQVENSHNVLEAQDIPALVSWRTEDQIIPANHARDLPSQDNVHILEEAVTWSRWKVPQRSTN